mgnify:FL=1
MSEIKKNEVIEEVETVEETTETKEGFLTKAKGWVKRNGKKIAVGAVGIVGLGLAYSLGKNSSADSEDSNEEAEDDTVEVDYHDYATGGEE